MHFRQYMDKYQLIISANWKKKKKKSEKNTWSQKLVKLSRVKLHQAADLQFLFQYVLTLTYTTLRISSVSAKSPAIKVIRFIFSFECYIDNLNERYVTLKYM